MRNKPEPPVKWVLRDRLMAELYKPVLDQRDEELMGLIHTNCSLNQDQDIKDHGVIQIGHSHPSFAFNGQFYTLADVGPPVRNRVHPDLVERVRKHVEFYTEVLGFEYAKIQGYLDSVLSFSAAPADWSLLLPDTLQSTLRANIQVTSETEATIWGTRFRTDKELAEFLDKHPTGFNLIRQRLATNLISI